MTRYADLHIHTHYSDSTSSPQEVVEQAVKAGLQCIAITDHDTVAGIPPTIEAARPHDLEVLPGIELSTEINGKDIHMLGYLFDWKNTALVRRIEEMQNARVERMDQMIAKLAELGVSGITLAEVSVLAKSRSLGRPHLAAVLVEKGVVKNIPQAFNQYLAEGAPAYVPKFKQTPYEAIELIRGAGGIAVLAHPMLTNVDEIIPRLARSGLGGLEVHYPNCSPTTIDFYKNLARKYDLVVTGGSDAHGDAKKHTYVGRMKIDYALVEALKKAAVH